jgi:protein-tyrosine kinase
MQAMESVTGTLHIARMATLLEGASNNSRQVVEGPNRKPPFEAVLPQAFEKIESESISPTYLQAHRIVAFDSGDSMTRCYDVLRNQLINEQNDEDKLGHQIAVTAPTKGCGVTVTAANLALSFARVHDAYVLLVDMNHEPPAIGSLLGLPPMTRNQELSGSLTSVEANGTHIYVLRPGWHDNTASGRIDASRLMAQISEARQRVMPTVIIYDMPPVMVADELNVIVKEADSVVVVLAVGHSKLSDFEVCKTFLGPREGVRVVLNKSRKHGL